MPAVKNTGIKRVYMATYYSLKGLKAAFISEAAIRQQLCLFALLVPIALIANVSLIEKILLIAMLVLVLAMELINTAIEAVVDRISDEHHALSEKAKDTASAGVFLTILLAIGVWLAIFIGQ